MDEKDEKSDTHQVAVGLIEGDFRTAVLGLTGGRYDLPATVQLVGVVPNVTASGEAGILFVGEVPAHGDSPAHAEVIRLSFAGVLDAMAIATKILEGLGVLERECSGLYAQILKDEQSKVH